MDSAILKRYLNKIEEVVGEAEENEADIQELGDGVIRIVNDIRAELRKEE